MNPDTWKLIASIGGLLVTTVTAPFLWAIRAESKAIRAEIKADIQASEAKLEKQITGVETSLQKQITGVRTEVVEMENRLNQRIDTRLVHR